MEIITPLYYFYQKYNYGKSKNFTNGFYDWHPETIKRIITNDEYTGILRRKKTYTRFKSNKITLIPREEQHVFYDKYEPIIDKATFETAFSQASLVKQKYTNDKINRYSGLVYCGICGQKLRHKVDYRVNRRDFIRLICRTPECGPNRGTILYEDLDKIIIKEVMELKKVILPSNLNDNNLIEEERRLLYVAMTRAKEYLYLSSAEYHYINGIRKRLRPSIFLCELKI